jgi:hypothetical protein
VQEGLFAVEVVVQQPLRDAGRCGDGLDRRRLVPVLGEQRERRVDDALSGHGSDLLVLFGGSRAHERF